MAFSPDTLQVAPGDSVVWVNHDLFPHTSTATGQGGWDTHPIAAGDSVSVVVTDAGEFSYICTLHTTMQGRLVIRSGPRRAGDGDLPQ